MINPPKRWLFKTIMSSMSSSYGPIWSPCRRLPIWGGEGGLAGAAPEPIVGLSLGLFLSHVHCAFCYVLSERHLVQGCRAERPLPERWLRNSPGAARTLTPVLAPRRGFYNLAQPRPIILSLSLEPLARRSHPRLRGKRSRWRQARSLTSNKVRALYI